MEQVKAYLGAVENPHRNPGHFMKPPWKTQRGIVQVLPWRTGQRSFQVAPAQGYWTEDSVNTDSMPTNRAQAPEPAKEWERYPNRFQRLYETLPAARNLGKHCREWPAGTETDRVRPRRNWPDRVKFNSRQSELSNGKLRPFCLELTAITHLKCCSNHYDFQVRSEDTFLQPVSLWLTGSALFRD